MPPSKNGHLSRDGAEHVPRLSEPFPFLSPEDYVAWRTYARGFAAAVRPLILREKRPIIASLIDTVADGETILGQRVTEIRADFPRVKAPAGGEWDRLDPAPVLAACVPGLLSPVDWGREQPGVRKIVIQALTSEEWTIVLSHQADQETSVDWYTVAYGVAEPALGAHDDIGAAIDIVKTWPQYTVYAIASRVNQLTLHPGRVVRKSYGGDVYEDFFDGIDSPEPVEATPSMSSSSP